MTNRVEIAAAIAAKVNALTEAKAMEVYSSLRLFVMGERKKGQQAPASAADAMTLAGDALEARIGEDRFFELIDSIDNHVFA
ncbi:MAG: hypothetical protein EpisKO_06130 [Epibacterium sp.]